MITLRRFQQSDIPRLVELANNSAVQAWVFEDNLASMRVLEKAGFHKEAVLKRALYIEGEFFDEHVYALLRHTD